MKYSRLLPFWHIIIHNRKNYILLFVFTVGCNRAVLQEREVFIQKDTTILTQSVRIDTVLKTLTGTIRKRNVVVAFSYDTIKIRVVAETKPETIRVPTIYVYKKTIEKVPEKNKKTNALLTGIIASAITILLFLLIPRLTRLLKLFH